MTKLKSIIQYECATSFKYIWIFYAAEYAGISMIFLITFLSTGSLEHIGVNALEMNSIIYVGVLGVLGQNEDFRMLIQNGFTRKYIFIAIFSMFAFICGILAFVDVIMGRVLHFVLPSYTSMYGGIYGMEQSIVANWIWLVLLYLIICVLLYFSVLLWNRLGKTGSLVLISTLAASALAIVALFRYVLPKGFVSQVTEGFLHAMGFLKDGTINLILPVLTLLAVTVVFSGCSYLLIRRTEL